MTDEEALTLVIWGESRGSPIEEQIGVAMVVRNRFLTHYLGAQSISEVCVAHEQFSAWQDEAAAMLAEEEMLTGDPSLAHHADPVIKRCLEIARATIAGTLADNTGPGANHYWAVSIPTPYWAKDVPSILLGTQRFVRVA
jgi:spore germination cell wall hydrolase CwlJ-like protein